MLPIERKDGMPVQVRTKSGEDIRLVLNTGCQSGCDFCHLEGNKAEYEVGKLNYALIGWRDKTKRDLPLIEKLGNAITPQDVQTAISICSEMGLKNIHLTGGEPTLHPNFLSIVQQINRASLSASLTTHGEYNSQRFEMILKSGIMGINFSVHTVTPEQYLGMDLVAQERAQSSVQKALDYSKSRLALKKANINRAVEYKNTVNPGMKVNANCVVQHTQTTLDVLDYLVSTGLNPRLQCDLNKKDQSLLTINEIIESLHAEPVLIEVAEKDSSGSGIYYEYPNGKFKVKSFGDIYIEEMCSTCSKKETTQCRERFYGVRVEAGKVSTCIDVDVNEITRFSSETFLKMLRNKEAIPGEIASNYLVK